jgi:23S rRNA-/tRNA-specific pseudouridylate synthase
MKIPGTSWHAVRTAPKKLIERLNNVNRSLWNAIIPNSGLTLCPSTGPALPKIGPVERKTKNSLLRDDPMLTREFGSNDSGNAAIDDISDKLKEYSILGRLVKPDINNCTDPIHLYNYGKMSKILFRTFLALKTKDAEPYAENAIACFKRILQLGDTTHTPHLELTYIYFMTNRLYNAKGHCQQGLSIEPTDKYLLYTMAKILQCKYRWEEALMYMDKLILLKPNDPDVADLRKAIKEHCDHIKNVNTEAVALVKNKQLAEAKKLLNELVVNHPNTNSFNWLSHISSQEGDKFKAIKRLHSSLKFDPTDEYALRNLAILEKKVFRSQTTQQQNIKNMILFEDDAICVINKPSGILLSHSKSDKLKLSNLPQEQYDLINGYLFANNVFMEASGITVMVKSPLLFQRFSQSSKTFERFFSVIVKGNLPESGTITIQKENGYTSKIHYTATKKYGDHTLVRVTTEGKGSNLINNGFASVNCAVIGTKERSMIHLGKVEFTHPGSGKHCTFESDLPEDMKKFFEEPVV